MQKSSGKMLFSLCNLYVCAVVGAGFATGQEIMRFFTSYGPVGFLGVLLAGGLLMIVAPMILRKSIAYDAHSMGELMSFRLGKRSEWVMGCINFFLEFAVLIVMLAGLRTLLCQMGMKNIVAVLMLLVLLFVASFCKKTALRINNFLTPIVILGITIMGSVLLVQQKEWSGWRGSEIHLPYPWWVSALLYAGFNLLLATPALCLAGKILSQKKTIAISGGTLGGLCISVMALLSQCLLFAAGPAIRMEEMPIIHLAMKTIPWMGAVYSWILFCAMLSSAIICICCILDLSPHGAKGKQAALSALICILATACSFFDFSWLIHVLYPFFGVVGILAVLLILW